MNHIKNANTGINLVNNNEKGYISPGKIVVKKSTTSNPKKNAFSESSRLYVDDFELFGGLILINISFNIFYLVKFRVIQNLLLKH